MIPQLLHCAVLHALRHIRRQLVAALRGRRQLGRVRPRLVQEAELEAKLLDVWQPQAGVVADDDVLRDGTRNAQPPLPRDSGARGSTMVTLRKPPEPLRDLPQPRHPPPFHNREKPSEPLYKPPEQTHNQISHPSATVKNSVKSIEPPQRA